MEMLLITDTYLSSVPFGGGVIKTNNDNPSSGRKKMQTRSKKVEQSGESPVYGEPGLAAGNRASLKSDCVDHQLTCFVLLLIWNLHYTTFPSALQWLRLVANVWLGVTKARFNCRFVSWSGNFWLAVTGLTTCSTAALLLQLLGHVTVISFFSVWLISLIFIMVN